MVELEKLKAYYEVWEGTTRTGTTLEKLNVEIQLAILERLDKLVDIFEGGKIIVDNPLKYDKM